MRRNMGQSPVQVFSDFRLLCEHVSQRPTHQLRQDSPVWIFGAGNFGRDLCKILRSEGFHVRGFIESRPREELVLGLSVVAWHQLHVDDLTGQLAIGIFNRDMPLDELRGIASSAGFVYIFMPWDLYSQFSKQLGWRFWLSLPETILDNLPALERTYRCLADEESRRCLLEMCAFRLGLHTAYAGFTHPERQYFNDLTFASLAGKKVTYIDGGAYNGDTFLELAAFQEVSAAYLFEPDADNFRDLVAAVKSSAGNIVVPSFRTIV